MNASPQDIRLIDKLIEGTGAGKIDWQATAVDSQYTASFKGKWSVLVTEYNPGGAETWWSVTIQDSDEREMLRMTEEDYLPVRKLYEAARRSALNVDEAIKDILKDLEDDILF